MSDMMAPGPHDDPANTKKALTTDRPTVAEMIEQARKWPRDGVGEGRWFNAMADEIERLQEVLTIPIITPEAPPGVHLRVLSEHEKGQPVNGQDLINALMWRVANQRREIAHLNKWRERVPTTTRSCEEFGTDD